MSEPFVYLNGEFIPASQAHIAIYDASVVLGATVTDMTRTFGKVPFRLDDHVARFYRSCRYTRITPEVTAAETTEIAEELIRRNSELLEPHQDLALVKFISPGELRLYTGAAGRAGEMPPTYCIHTFPLPFQVWRHYFTEGVHVVTPSVRHVPPQCVDPKIKCRSRMHWWLADRETHLVDPNAVSLCLDLDGNVTETSGSNFLIYTGDEIVSPGRRNVLRGVSVQTVSELCQELNVSFVERDFQIHDVINAREAFLASTPYCLAPVTQVNGIPVGNGQPGTMLHRLLDRWSQRVGVNIIEQITSTAHEAEAAR
ncbi:MAG: aminotransferase class IV [Fuerstiella sp.]|nr:aminotransferase class IV [Fuerstiella sp.]